MKVHIPSPLIAYTGKTLVDASGKNLAELLDDLDRQFPGIRFRVIDEQDRMRPHMRLFVNNEQVFDINQPLQMSDSIVLVQALSGG